MSKLKWAAIFFILLFSIVISSIFLGEERKEQSAPINSEKANIEKYEKGYDLPIDEAEKELAKTDCFEVMEKIRNIYTEANKEKSVNAVLPDAVIYGMHDRLKETGYPITTNLIYSNMVNYVEMDSFLNSCLNGKSDSVVTYNLRSDGGVSRMEYTFDGDDMYVLCVNAMWNIETEPAVTEISYTRIKEWQYTENGWFCYELSVPEYPEVTEVIDGSCLVRVAPIRDENRELSEKYVLGLGYKGNNLLCSNWNAENMEALDYSGMYEYLYEMKYQTAFPYEEYLNGIPAEEFESLIMEYLPITPEQIKEYAAFNAEKQTYNWAKLGCGTFNKSFFSTSFPEVINTKENDDGTITLTVNAVCEMMLCDDAVITHELTIRFSENGSFQYLGNEILDDGIENIPTYQYRICNEIY